MNRVNTESPTTAITDLCKEISNQTKRSSAASVRKVLFETHNPSTKKTRKVNFSNEPVTKIHYIQNVPPASSMTSTEKQCQWYTCTELTQFRENVKSLAMRMHIFETNNDDCTQQTTPQQRQFENYFKNSEFSSKHRIGDDSVQFLNLVQTHARGLETRIFIKRQLKRMVAKKTILECQRRLQIRILRQNHKTDKDVNFLKKVCASKLAVLSEQQNKWAKDVARMTGQYDYEEGYKCNNTTTNELQQAGEKVQCLLLQKRKRMSTTTHTTPTRETTTFPKTYQMNKKQRREYPLQEPTRNKMVFLDFI